ncbi:ammonium transporter Rh type B-like [Hippocampus zosterae]|uniref:ammonium transporter Rh type B-like n=1 Tax=Hippocampus zosterae TaxID=109293 RepID=UPI00223DD4C9|nr:ammonium transporter Rh type B-like [Hippocampus zosterae]
MVERGTVILLEVVIFIALMDVLFALFVTPLTTTNTDEQTYPYSADIGLMVLFGFGLMAAYYERFSLTTLSMQLVTVCQCIILYIFLEILWRSSSLGRLGFLELFNHNIITMIFYTLTEALIVDEALIFDTGRTMSLFSFAGTVSFLLSFAFKKDNEPVPPARMPSTRGYVLALVGTGLCWVFFGSFNSANAVGYQRTLAYANTWFSLAMSTLTVFTLSYVIQGKLDPYTVIFSSLSGGIAIGCTADLIKSPSAALFIGILAGLVVFMANWLNAFSRWSEDSTGLGNLSVVSGMVGSIMSCIIITFYRHDGGRPSEFDISFPRSFGVQAGFQFVGLIIAMCLGLACAAINYMLLFLTRSSYE